MRDARAEEAAIVAAVMRRSAVRPRGAAEEKDVAVDRLFRQHYPTLVRIACTMLGTRDAAEDAVQEAFVSLYRHWGQLRSPDLAESYLRSAVLNRCRSRIRDLIRSRTFVRSSWERSAPAQDSDGGLIDREDAAGLAVAVRQLPRRQREVLVCRYLMELSVAQTAQMLGISDGAVKVHAHRGLHRLHTMLEGAP